MESVRSSASSNDNNITEDPTARCLQPQPQYPRNPDSVGQRISYSGDSWHPYSNIPHTEDLHGALDVGGFCDREVIDTCLHTFPNPVRVVGYSHMLLTDTDKLQQFSNLKGYSKDGAMQSGVLGQPPVFDNAQVKPHPTGHQGVSPGGYCLPSQSSRQSLERRSAYALSSNEETGYHGATHDLTAWLHQHRQHLRQQQLADNFPSSQVTCFTYVKSTIDLFCQCTSEQIF